MDFVNSIPIWVYILIAGLGLVLGAVLIFMHVRAPLPPGRTSRGATPQLVFGIISIVLLTIVPLVLMTVALTQGDGRERRGDRDRSRGGEEARDDPGDMSWRVRFEGDGVVYRGQFEPRGGSGPLKLVYTYEGVETRVRQDCILTGERQVSIRCRNPRILSGRTSYAADNFELRWDGEDEMTGTVSADGGASGTATFTRGTDPQFSGASWNAAGTAAQAADDQPAVPSAGGGDLAALLSAAVEEQRSELPIRDGPATITAMEATGTRLNLWMEISTDLAAADWSQLDQALRTQTCEGPFAALIQAGASVGYQMLDAGEEQRTLVVASC